MAAPEPLHESRFQAAVKVIQNLPKNGSFQPSHEMMLKFYSFYKQATQGPCQVPRPGFWDPVGRYKWDAWSALGVMSKEDAMVAYVNEMKKILESMPINEKVEELLQVIGPFYEIVDDKKPGHGSAVTSVRLDKVAKSLEELSSVLTSTPNCKAVNGKTESSDSGAESEDGDEDEQEEVAHTEEETELSEKEELILELESPDDEALESILPNGFDNTENIAPPPALENDNQTKSALNGTNHTEDMEEIQSSVEPVGIPDASVDKDDEEEQLEDISTMHHLTSDSDSEVFCDSMEQFGQEDSSDVGLSSQIAHCSHFKRVDHSQLLENAIFPENRSVTFMDSGVESMVEAAVEGKGEVKDGGEDGKPTGRGPHKEVSSDRMDNYAPRRGRGSRMQPSGAGAQGWQSGSGGDGGERWGSERGPKSSLNEQIAAVLMRLQEDMQNVLQRLHTLEALTASQARSVALQSNDQPASYPRRKPSWWPFETSPGTLAFALVWPFIAQWLVHVFRQRRKRKLN